MQGHKKAWQKTGVFFLNEVRSLVNMCICMAQTHTQWALQAHNNNSAESLSNNNKTLDKRKNNNTGSCIDTVFIEANAGNKIIKSL